MIVEDAADDFQKILDFVNLQVFFEMNTELQKLLKKQPISNVILQDQSLKQAILSKDQIQEFSTKLKLPAPLIFRLHSLLLYSVLDTNTTVQTAFRLYVKKRYYIREVKNYMVLFKGQDDNILVNAGGLKEPYIFNSEIEENPFCRGEEEKRDQKEIESERILT